MVMAAATTIETPAAVRAADSSTSAQLAEVDKASTEQLAMAKTYPGGRTMQVGGLVPANLEEAVRVANLLAKSALVPKDMRERPADVLAALMLGADVGLAPMQALQSIAVINGRPSMWGDGMLAVVMAHPQFEDIAETWEDADGGTAVCSIWRRGRRQPTVCRFSHQDAQKANLLSKDTYKSYERRMLKMRARSWALRDSVPDALRGIIAAEEAQDFEVVETDHTVIPMPQRASEVAQQQPTTTQPEPTVAAPATTESDAVPAGADWIKEILKNGPATNGHHWWTVTTGRGVVAYTWSTTIAGQLEKFQAEKTPIDLDVEKDSRGDFKVSQVQKFDPFGGAGSREPGSEG